MQVLSCGSKPFLSPSKSADRGTIQPGSLLAMHQSMNSSNGESSRSKKENHSMEKSMAKELQN